MQSPHQSVSPRLARKSKAAIALMRGGVTDPALIARAVGLPVEEVQAIESADDPRARWYAIRGFDDEFTHRLQEQIKCPRCGCRINLVPCVNCKVHEPRRPFTPMRSHPRFCSG